MAGRVRFDSVDYKEMLRSSRDEIYDLCVAGERASDAAEFLCVAIRVQQRYDHLLKQAGDDPKGAALIKSKTAEACLVSAYVLWQKEFGDWMRGVRHRLMCEERNERMPALLTSWDLTKAEHEKCTRVFGEKLKNVGNVRVVLE
ncbi:MAG: hypothetical protein OXF02_07595 [Simkaniaceae bacterium]|nr:hypothetical protein [Simkaniaceae bacterium]